jgi:RsiW-degrading membrane proteinase PrsW (M82 family)
MAAKMIAVILVFTYAGRQLDEYMSNDFKWFTMIGALLGAGFAMYAAIIDLLK